MTHVSCWAGLGWAGLQQLPSQHRDNTPDLGITRAALAGSRPRPALDFLPTYSHCASSAASKLCIVERSAGVRSVLICWCQHSVPVSAGSKLQTHDMMLQISLQHGAAEAELRCCGHKYQQPSPAPRQGPMLGIYWISTHGIVRVSTKCYLKARATLALPCTIFIFVCCVPCAGCGSVLLGRRPRPYLEIFVHKSGLLHYRSTPPAPPTATSTHTLREHYLGIMVVEKSRI